MAVSAFTPVSWPVETRATLCRVPWDASYKDVVLFGSYEDQSEYFAALEGQSFVLERMTYLKPYEPITVNVPYSAAYRCNYIVVENPRLPVPGEGEPPRLFYFVERAEYVAPNTTELSVSLDVWQTYSLSMRLGSCFVESGHLGVHAACRHDKESATRFMRRYCMRDEPVATGGSTYIVTNAYTQLSEWDVDGHEGEPNDDSSGYYVLIASMADLTKDWGTLADPSLDTAGGCVVDGIPEGCEVYAVKPTEFRKMMRALSNYSWVAKGIASMRLFPGFALDIGEEVSFGAGSFSGYEVASYDEFSQIGMLDFYDAMSMWLSSMFGDRYDTVKLKLMTSAFVGIELNRFDGSPLELRPEGLPSTGLYVKPMVCADPMHARIALVVPGYGKSDDQIVGDIEYEYRRIGSNEVKPHSAVLDGGAFLDEAVTFADFPLLSTVADNANYALASSINTAKWGYENAYKDLANARLAADLARFASYNSLANSVLNSALSQWLGGTFSTGGNVAASLLNADVGGAVGSAVSNIGRGLTTAAHAASDIYFTRRGTEQAYGTAMTAAANDYRAAVSGVTAGVKDLQLATPSVLGEVGGSGFNLSHGLFGVRASVKTCSPEFAAAAGEFFLRYGYSVGEFVDMSQDGALLPMSRFSYVKLGATYIECQMSDEGSKEEIRAILERGVVIWRDPADIGLDVAADNVPNDHAPYYGNAV